MSIESGSFYEGPTAVDQLEMARIKLELAQAIEASSVEAGSQEINRDPLLHSILTKIIESGPELNPDIVRHLRKMVALRIGHLIEAGLRAGDDAEFWALVQSEVMDEIEALKNLEGLEDLPDPSWDFALQDLLELEDEE